VSPLPSDPRSRPARGTGEILVTGATGLLGRSLCRALGRRKVHHRALVRPSSNRDLLDGAGAYTWMIEGDLTAPRTLAPAAEGVKAVLHLAGLVRSGDEVACRAVHVEGTRALLGALDEGVRFVVLSSDTVLRKHRGAYAESKAAMEELVRECSGVQAVLLRPPMILGPGSPHLSALERAARLPVIPVPDGVARRAPVHVDDVVDAVLAALNLDDALFTEGALTIDLPGADELPFGEVVQTLAAARGWRVPPVIDVPAPLSRGAVRMLERLGRTQRAESIDRKVRGMRESVLTDSGPARELLGWCPRPLVEVLAAS